VPYAGLVSLEIRRLSLLCVEVDWPWIFFLYAVMGLDGGCEWIWWVVKCEGMPKSSSLGKDQKASRAPR
jgi:hypothetical protein